MTKICFYWVGTNNTLQKCQIEAVPGYTILQLARLCGVPLEANCGGNGRCGKCKVIVKGQVAPLDPVEERVLTETEKAKSVRLACRCIPLDDVEVSFSHDTLEGLTISMGLEVPLSPDISVQEFWVPESTTPNFMADLARIEQALGEKKIPTYSFLQHLPGAMREQGPWQVISYADHLLDILPFSKRGEVFGVAIDVGTTTVAAGLSNLMTGEEIAVTAEINGQVVLGADVITRINEAEKLENLMQLQSAVVDTINRVIEALCSQVGVAPSRIYRAIVVGNTCMQHLLLGVSPISLAQAPYSPVFTREVTYPAKTLGLAMHPEAPVSLLPSIAGFVGADAVGVILASGLSRLSGTHLAIDVGTNGEIVLCRDGEMFACSTAAGPAFEGGHIRWGMRAAAGAVDRVWVSSDIHYHTIGNEAPAGICGSGLIDLVAVLLDLGVIDPAGRLLASSEVNNLPKSIQDRLVEGKDTEFVLAWEDETQTGEKLVLTAQDVRQVQLAKGAIQAGIRVLAAEAEIDLANLHGVYLAGAFGSYVNCKSAMRIGLLPKVKLDKIHFLGNAAKEGARMALVCEEKLREGRLLARSVHYVELSTEPKFAVEFMDAMLF